MYYLTESATVDLVLVRFCSTGHTVNGNGTIVCVTIRICLVDICCSWSCSCGDVYRCRELATVRISDNYLVRACSQASECIISTEAAAVNLVLVWFCSTGHTINSNRTIVCVTIRICLVDICCSWSCSCGDVYRCRELATVRIPDNYLVCACSQASECFISTEAAAVNLVLIWFCSTGHTVNGNGTIVCVTIRICLVDICCSWSCSCGDVYRCRELATVHISDNYLVHACSQASERIISTKAAAVNLAL